ncbi:putative ribonuclease H-like domain-containing protein [Tanacetum coccineum]|uniref:Ribonuclease H-like domain-containing protein n=1 Tax=Tanacetum coccineum TaxID=301880 RepID=A0ABQ5HSI5_9ASTR
MGKMSLNGQRKEIVLRTKFSNTRLEVDKAKVDVISKLPTPTNIKADHLSRLENDETSDDSEVDDNFPGETLMEINTISEPWFADFANYLVIDIIPKGMTYQRKNKFFSDLKHYCWKEPYLFKVCSDGMIKRCISGPETRTILDQCHHGPTGGHYGPNITAKKVLDFGFYWPTIIKEAHTLVRLCEACQKTRNISKRDEMPFYNIQVCEIFDIWGIDFMGPFSKYYKFEYISSAGDYVSKWAEAQALPTNEARVVVTFLKKLFCHFGMPKALISDPDLIAAGEKRIFQLHELDELRHQAYENSRLYEERTKVWHDRKLRMRKEFKQGNKFQTSNTYRPKINISSKSTVVPEINTATLEDLVGPSHASEDTQVEGQEIELGNIPQSSAVPTTPHTRIHKDHPIQHVIGDVQSSVQTRRMTTSYSEQSFLSAIYEGKTHQALHTSWVEAMQEELLQFKLQKVWILVDLLKGHRAIGTKWVYRNKKDERGIVIKNKARLVAQGHTQEEGIDYDEVFAPVARIVVIRMFLAYASYMGFMVYQMDIKSAFLYGQIEEEVYVCQPPGFEDPDHPDKVYKVVKALYGLHQAPRDWYDTLANYLLCNGFQRGKIDQTLFIKRQKGHILLVQIYVDDIIFGYTKKDLCDEFKKLMKDKFQMSSMGELTFFLGLQIQQKKKSIFISQDKYVNEILRKFNYTDVKSASTSTDLEKPLVQDGDAADVDEHLYRSMIGSLMYLTASRLDIMFVVCACARFHVSPKTSHLLAVNRIFRFLKGKPSLGLWYSEDSPLELVAYTDSDYAGATQDRKSTTGVATSTTEAEYVAAASCCGQVLWIQNQLLDYGYNFMNTVIYIDNNSTICIIENPIQHSKTKHIEIRHHFIRDCNAKKLIQMAKIDTQHNVADLLTKGFDAGRFQYLVSSIGMLNP